MLSIQEMDESEPDLRFSRYKSYKKIGTMKNIGGQKKLLLPKTKDSGFKHEPPRDSVMRILHGGVKPAKKRRENCEPRKGNWIKRGKPKVQLSL